MDNPYLISTGAMIRDTFREAFARKIFWGLFGLSSAIILFFLFILRIDIVEGATATLSLFGMSSGRVRDLDRMVIGAYAAIATFLYSFGMFLAVFASSGLTPSLLEAGRIELLLSKPVNRVHLLMCRYAGNLLVVAVNTVWLITGVWLILGWKTGIWKVEFLAAIGTILFLFAVLLAVVMLVGVASDSGALATMITVGLMLISPILAQSKIVEKLLDSEWSRQLWKGLYYTLPKVYDIAVMTLNIVRDRSIESWMPVWSSALFGVACLGLALLIFWKRDF